MDFGGPHSTVHAFSPAALTVAREYRGVRKNELAAKLEVTPSAITQFEGGTVRPNAATLARAAVVLGFPLAFFANGARWSPLPTDQCHFRSLRSATQQDRRRMLATAALLRGLVEYIDSHVNLPPEDLTRISREVHDDDDIELLAGNARAAWQLGTGPIPTLLILLESRGIVVFRVPSDCDKVDAFSFWNKDRPFIFLNSDKGSSSRSRFDAAHELGHLLMHVDCVPGDGIQELQAHRFAGAFLMPRSAITRELPGRLNWPHLFELKRRWGVSLAALLRRGYDLGVYSDSTYRRANTYLSMKGWRSGEPAEPAQETPELIRDSMLTLFHAGVTAGEISSALGISTSILNELVATADANEQSSLLFGNVRDIASALKRDGSDR
jgi:Zn-dependent peptidase ImmA (M78 family)/transcriptional regulator with XRE-family HTH domain